jgi:hypothetical protein
LIKRLFPRIVYRKQLAADAAQGMVSTVDKIKATPLSTASYNIFTYHGEDGIIYYLSRQLQPLKRLFVDIGSGDCIKSNCATLAIHFGWRGLFLDNDATQLDVGKSFYRQKIEKGAAIRFVKEKVTPLDINNILEREGVSGEIGLLSIDIDGNDYWVWQAIHVIQPQIVVIEAKVEFGLRDVVVPYGDNNHHAADAMYNGASVEALRKLGEKKGYKLVGANYEGYNLFFVKEGTSLPAATTAALLQAPGIKASFYPDSFFTSHTFAPI